MLTGGKAAEPGRLTAFNVASGGTSWVRAIDAAMVGNHPTGCDAGGCEDMY